MNEVLHQQRYVLASVPQRREQNGDDVQPVKQILPEPPVADQLRQIGVGGRNNPDVDLDRAGVPQSLQLALLQDPQELGLQAAAHRSDLVKKERAQVGGFELPLACGDGASKGAARMPEELCFEERFRHRAAVQGDKPVPPARAVVMDGPGRQFLAGAGLTLHQDRARARRHCFEQCEELSHEGTAPDQSLEAITLLQLRP